MGGIVYRKDGKTYSTRAALRRGIPNVSLPWRLTDEVLAELGVEAVRQESVVKAAPKPNRAEIVRRLTMLETAVSKLTAAKEGE